MEEEEAISPSLEPTDCEVDKDTPRLVSKPRTKSAIWQYFGVKLDSDGKPMDNGLVFCKICHRGVMAKSGNTSNLMAHLKNNHKSVHSQLKIVHTQTVIKPSQQPTIVKPSKQPTIAASLIKSQPYNHQSRRWKELTDAITNYIVKDGLPIYAVQKEGRSLIVVMKYLINHTFHEQQSPICMQLLKQKSQNSLLMLTIFLPRQTCGPVLG